MKEERVELFILHSVPEKRIKNTPKLVYDVKTKTMTTPVKPYVQKGRNILWYDNKNKKMNIVENDHLSFEFGYDENGRWKGKPKNIVEDKEEDEVEEKIDTARLIAKHLNYHRGKIEDRSTIGIRVSIRGDGLKDFQNYLKKNNLKFEIM